VGRVELDLRDGESLQGAAEDVDFPPIDHVADLLQPPVARQLEECAGGLFVDADLYLAPHAATAGFDREQVLTVAGADAHGRLAAGDVALADLGAARRRPQHVRLDDAAQEATFDLDHPASEARLAAVDASGEECPDPVAMVQAATMRSTISIPMSPRSMSRATAPITRARTSSGESRSRGSR